MPGDESPARRDEDGRQELRGPLLALETSGDQGSLAVGGADGTPLGVTTLPARRRQAAEAAPAAVRILEEAGVAPDELAGVLVGAGPGSFTGVRVAAATAKGWARYLEIPLWTGSSLAAAALAGVAPDGSSASELSEGPGPLRYVLFDARGDRVYGACYRVDDAGVATVVEAHAGTVADVLDTGPDPRTVFVGAGARRHRELLERAGYMVAEEPWGDPSARSLLVLAGRAPSLLARAGPTWEPTYVRASNAERSWNG